MEKAVIRLRWTTKSDPLITLWGRVIHARDRATCQKCGRQGVYTWALDAATGRRVTAGPKLDAAHVFGRRTHPKLKYDPDAGILLCALPCHAWFDTHRSRTHDGDAERWVESKWPGRIQALLMRERFRGKVDKSMVKILLRAELERLQHGSVLAV